MQLSPGDRCFALRRVRPAASPQEAHAERPMLPTQAHVAHRAEVEVIA